MDTGSLLQGIFWKSDSIVAVNLIPVHIDQPLRLAALIGHQAEYRCLAEHGAEHLHPGAIAISAYAEDGVSIIHCR